MQQTIYGTCRQCGRENRPIRRDGRCYACLARESYYRSRGLEVPQGRKAQASVEEAAR